jgi:ribosome-associated protein
LRFDINSSSLPEFYKERLRELRDKRISREGVIVIKAQRFRSLEKNRADALERLRGLLQNAGTPRKKRVATRPTRGSKERRLEEKNQRSRIKSLRSRINGE